LSKILEGPYTRHVGQPAEKLLAIVKLVQERLKKLSEFDALTDFFFERLPYEASELVPKKSDAEFARQVLNASGEVLRGIAEWRTRALEEAVRVLCEERGWKRGDAYMVLRVAMTSRTVSTPLFETMEILGRDECMARLAEASDKTSAL